MAFVDIETTGGSHFTSRVLEVGVVRVEGNRVVSTYKTLLHPDEPIPAFITGLTGITDDQVTESPKFASVANELADILDGAIFVAHNVRFDYSFLKMEFERLGVPFRPKLLCTVRLSRRLYPEYRTHKLADLITRHHLSAPSRHRAYDDAHCLWQFYQYVLAQFDLDTIENAIRAQLSAPSIPSQLDRAQVDALPEGPGVYIFENEDGTPLYVGKSVSVKRRVMNHFASDYERGAEQKMAQQVKTLRGVATHGELSALLLESDLIKELQPMYNRALRQKEHVVLVLIAQDANGYLTVNMLEDREISPEVAPGILSVFSTPARAKQSLHATSMKYRLCPKLLGLENTNRACFGSQLGKCDGACQSLETAESYNLRFKAAFERVRVAAWPFSGPILVKEQQLGLEGSTGYVIDNWCLVARLREFEDGSVESNSESHLFDLDRYKIIRRFLSNPVNKNKVTRVTAEQLGALFV